MLLSGPASSDEATLTELIKAGLDIARLNFSHGDHETHRKNIELVRRLSRELGRDVAILQDLQGPKIRTGKMIDEGDGGLIIKKGERYILAYGVEQKKPSDDSYRLQRTCP